MFDNKIMLSLAAKFALGFCIFVIIMNISKNHGLITDFAYLTAFKLLGAMTAPFFLLACRFARAEQKCKK